MGFVPIKSCDIPRTFETFPSALVRALLESVTVIFGRKNADINIRFRYDVSNVFFIYRHKMYEIYPRSTKMGEHSNIPPHIVTFTSSILIFVHNGDPSVRVPSGTVPGAFSFRAGKPFFHENNL